MTITIKPGKVTAILIAGAGWENISQGTLKLDTLELTPATPTETSEDYGFQCVHDSGDIITGRASALLATKQAP